jgi:hypothetical protein
MPWLRWAEYADLVDVWAQALVEEFAETGIVIDPTNDAANLAALLQPVEARIDSWATTQVQEVSRRKSPASSCPSNAV